MKKLIFVLAMLSVTVFNSCTKEEIDVRENFVGSWKGTNTSIIPDLDINQVVEVDGIISKKVNSDNEIEFASDDENTPNMIATVNGNSYTYEDYTYTQNVNGKTASIIVKGGGSINGSVITESGTLIFNMDGESYNGSWSSTMNKQ